MIQVGVIIRATLRCSVLLLLVSQSSPSQVAEGARWLVSSISCPFAAYVVVPFGGGRCVAGAAGRCAFDDSPVVAVALLAVPASACRFWSTVVVCCVVVNLTPLCKLWRWPQCVEARGAVRLLCA